jgi:XTP/dITP diphosphohydrolase
MPPSSVRGQDSDPRVDAAERGGAGHGRAETGHSDVWAHVEDAGPTHVEARRREAGHGEAEAGYAEREGGPRDGTQRDGNLCDDARGGNAARTRLVVATGNPGKLREFQALLADLPFDIVAQTELGVAAPEETGATFLENALLKARHAAAATHNAAIADDSGLEVDALDGAPGIYSARYAGVGADDAANNAKLLAALRGVPAAQRRARYRCVLVFVAGPADPAPATAEGVWEGCIVDSPRGSAGFGYDPHFWLPDLRMTAAELDPAEKNRRSHRGMALRALRERLLARELSAGG